MIWSNSPSTVAATERRLQQAGMLRRSSLIHSRLEELGHNFEPVHFFHIPKQPAKQLGKLVTPFVTISEDGFLKHPSRGVYGIRTSATEEQYYADETKELFEEAHAMTERTAYSRGLFTQHGRSTSEVTLALVIPRHFREKYITERIDYLQVLSLEAKDHPGLKTQQREILTAQLALGVTALQAAIE